MVESAATITCKASVVFEANAPFTVIDVKVAPPKAGEVRVKVLTNALCHTDVYTQSGQDAEGRFPSILGHEATAVVTDVGEGVTEYAVGDLVIPCYTPECRQWDCIFCQSEKTNLCPRVRSSQGQGVMPDGTSRFSTMDDKVIYHFMGCSTFSEYTVLCAISLAKINTASDPKQMCMLGCGVSTGWGAVMNNPNFRNRTSVAVWGCGAVGMAVIQAAKYRGATRIYALDVNEAKFAIAKEFGATDCHNPMTSNAGEWLKEREQWGIDFTFDCTGNVRVMRDALEAAHRGYGESTVIGVAAAGQTLETRPFQLVTGRVWKGTAFGGWKSRQDVPKLVNKVLLGELPIDKYLTHEFEGLDKVNDMVKTMHEGSCLRAVVNINEWQPVGIADKITVVKTEKSRGGVLKTVEHWSNCNNCTMTFTIYLPEGEVDHQRREPYPAIYFLSGLTSSYENATVKLQYARQCAKRQVAMVICDTSPRGIEETCPDAGKDWNVGYGAGQYCNATQEPWSKHFNMYTYVTEELPNLVEKYFHVDSEKRSVMGFSMGGNGALIAAAKLPERYQCFTSFSPIGHPTQCVKFSIDALTKYFGSAEAAADYSIIEVLNAKGTSLKLPPGSVEVAANDQFIDEMNWPELTAALNTNGHRVPMNWHEDYNHSYFFVNDMIDDAIDFHAGHLYK